MTTTDDQLTSLEKAPQDSRYPYAIFSEGDRCHVRGYSDIHPGTVIGVTRNGKQVTVRRDSYKLAAGQKPEIMPGGFCGHCTNQSELEYDITEDPKGNVEVFTLRKWRGRYCWTLKGQSADGKQEIGSGWRAFYDYSF